MAERQPRHKRESAAERILRQHDETTRKASRSSSRGKEMLDRAATTQLDAANTQKTFADAQNAVSRAGQAGLEELGRVQA